MKRFFLVENINYLFILFLFAVIISACEQNDKIGLNTLPQNDLVGLLYSDTTSLIIRTQTDDSITNFSVSSALIGSYLDPKFGKVRSEFLTQLRLSSVSTPYTGDSPVFDSLVLFMHYEYTKVFSFADSSYTRTYNYYGNLTQPMTMKVYAITKDMLDTTIHASELNDYHNPNRMLGEQTFIPYSNDTAVSISLSQSFGAQLFDTLQISNSNEDLQSYFKGLFIKTTDGFPETAIIYFDNMNSKSVLRFYYHNDAADSLHYDLNINGYCRQNNVFSHDYTGSIALASFNAGTQDSLAYIQSMGGFKAEIFLPYLAEWTKMGNIALLEADLDIYVSEPDIDNYPAPQEMLLLSKNAENEVEYLPEYPEALAEYFDKSYRKYTFNITYFIQQLMIDSTKNNGLELYQKLRRSNAHRAIITSGNHPTKPAKLKLTYTKLNQ